MSNPSIPTERILEKLQHVLEKNQNTRQIIEKAAVMADAADGNFGEAQSLIKELIEIAQKADHSISLGKDQIRGYLEEVSEELHKADMEEGKIIDIITQVKNFQVYYQLVPGVNYEILKIVEPDIYQAALVKLRQDDPEKFAILKAQFED